MVDLTRYATCDTIGNMEKQYTRILIDAETRRVLKIVAATEGVTVIELVKRLALEALAKTQS